MMKSIGGERGKEPRMKMFKWTPSSDTVHLWSSNVPIPGWSVEFDRMQVIH